MSKRIHYGKFDSEAALLAAIRECNDRELPIVDAFTPYPVHGIDPLLGIKRSRLPFVTLAAGAVGLGLAFLFQYWSSAFDWPLNVGGKPFNSLPAFMPVAFELLVLFGGLATAFFLLLRSRLWPGQKSMSAHPRITSDRFVLMVEQRDAALRDGEMDEIWDRHGAIETWWEHQE